MLTDKAKVVLMDSETLDRRLAQRCTYTEKVFQYASQWKGMYVPML